MPEQPDDPIHYEMKIPPEPKDDEAKKDEDGSPQGRDENDKSIKRDDEHAERPLRK